MRCISLYETGGLYVAVGDVVSDLVLVPVPDVEAVPCERDDVTLSNAK